MNKIDMTVYKKLQEAVVLASLFNKIESDRN